MDVRILVSREMGGTLRGLYGGGGSSPNVSREAMLRASLIDTASDVSMPVKKPLFISVDNMTGCSCGDPIAPAMGGTSVRSVPATSPGRLGCDDAGGARYALWSLVTRPLVGFNTVVPATTCCISEPDDSDDILFARPAASIRRAFRL
jgi:hypothetical protein